MGVWGQGGSGDFGGSMYPPGWVWVTCPHPPAQGLSTPIYKMGCSSSSLQGLWGSAVKWERSGSQPLHQARGHMGGLVPPASWGEGLPSPAHLKPL